MVNRLPEAGAVFHALGDDTRRDIVGRLRQEPLAVSTLAAAYRMSLPAVLKHVRVLETAGLVGTAKAGRVRTCALRPEGLRTAAAWLAGYEHFWNDRLDGLERHLREEPT